MTLELLFPHFDELIRTPEDVQRLNEAILQLAVQGKLVPQDPEDEPAGELQNHQSVATTYATSPNRVFFSIPESWNWLQLGQLRPEFQNGCSRRTSADNGIETVVIRLADIVNGVVTLNNSRSIGLLSAELAKYDLRKGDILITRVNGSVDLIGGFTLVTSSGNLCYCDHFIRMRFANQTVDPGFLEMVGRSTLVRGQIKEKFITTAGQKTVNQTHVSTLWLPLPPLAEQHRIVAKVDELFAQTRALEAKLRQAQADIVTANRAALHRLHRAQDDDQFQAAWRTLRDHFDLLYDDPRNVAELRQAILDLAVRGKLVPQDAEDEPARELLNFVHQTSLSFLPIDLQINLFRKPTTWTWKRLGDLAEIVSGVTLGRNLQGYDMVALPYLRVANVQRGYLDLSEIKEVEVKVEEKDKYLLQEGDLLLTEGGDADKLGRAAIWRGQIPNCIHQNHIFRARPTGSAASADWLMLCTNSSYGRDYFLGSSKKTTNLATINSTQLRNCPIPVPPPAEQRRILAKVDQLMRLCDALQAGLVQAEMQRRSLTAAVLSGICRVAADSPV